MESVGPSSPEAEISGPSSASRSEASPMAREELKIRIDLIEETYEFLLAYAAQGLESDKGAKSGGELREYLERLDQALTGLSDLFRDLAASEPAESRPALLAYIDVIERDEQASIAKEQATAVGIASGGGIAGEFAA